MAIKTQMEEEVVNVALTENGTNETRRIRHIPYLFQTVVAITAAVTFGMLFWVILQTIILREPTCKYIVTNSGNVIPRQEALIGCLAFKNVTTIIYTHNDRTFCYIPNVDVMHTAILNERMKYIDSNFNCNIVLHAPQ